jgi:hypothetical protein
MRHIIFTVVCVLVLAGLAFYLSGCGAETIALSAGGSMAAAGTAYGVYRAVNPLIELILKEAGCEAAVYGLQALPSDSAPAIARDTILACDDILVYLNTGHLPTADIVNQIISEKFANLPPIVVSMIQAAAAKLGAYVPSASVVLTTDEIGDIQAFLKGIISGCQDWQKNPKLSVKAKYTLPQVTADNRLKAKFVETPGWFCAVKQK